jgi:hypothetical protein
LPLPLHLPAEPALRFRVAPYCARTGRAGDEVASCPASSVHLLCRRWIFELPRISHPSTLLVYVIQRVAPYHHASVQRLQIQASGRPSSRIFRHCRRWIFELPRISHPSALPVVKSRVAPFFRSSGIASDEVASCPASCISGTGWCSPELPRIWHLPVVPVVNLRVAPNLRSSGPPTDRISRLPRILDPSAVPTFEFPGCPESLTFRRGRLCFLGLPRFRIYGWIDDESPSVLELCILWQASG